MTGPSLHCLEGISLESSIRLIATQLPLCFDQHPALPDGVHGPFYNLPESKRATNTDHENGHWKLSLEMKFQIERERR